MSIKWSIEEKRILDNIKDLDEQSRIEQNIIKKKKYIKNNMEFGVNKDASVLKVIDSGLEEGVKIVEVDEVERKFEKDLVLKIKIKGGFIVDNNFQSALGMLFIGSLEDTGLEIIKVKAGSEDQLFNSLKQFYSELLNIDESYPFRLQEWFYVGHLSWYSMRPFWSEVYDEREIWC